MRVGLVHDWLVVPGGSERVLEAMLEQLPRATVRTILYAPANFGDSLISAHKIETSFLNRVPGATGRHRHFIPLMPLAVEQFDLSGEEMVISNMCAVAHGAITSQRQLHVAYVNRTMTYAWDSYHRDLAEFGVSRGVRGLIARIVYHYLRQWDYIAFQRPDVLVCNSMYSQRRIAKQYRREARVIYPPVNSPVSAPRTQGDYYVFVGRLVPVKRVDLLVSAFNLLGRSLIIVGDGPLRDQLEAMAKANVTFVAWKRPSDVAALVASSRAFVSASHEDFGIGAVEAQMLGVPVVAFGGCGQAESIVAGQTGLLFPRQEVHEVVSAIETFESLERQFDPDKIAQHASRFSKERFQREFFGFLEEVWDRFQHESQIDEPLSR